MTMKGKGEAQLNGVSAPGVSDAPSDSSSGCEGCARKLRSCIPVDYKKEIVELLKLAGPVVRVDQGHMACEISCTRH